MIQPEIRKSSRSERIAISESLGVQGIGAFVLQHAVSEEYLSQLPDLSTVPWRDNHISFQNSRGLTVIQQHDVYALKLRVGDQDLIEKTPYMRGLAHAIEWFVQGMADEFPVLANWRADEVSMHRYDQPDIGLSRHRDNLRFWGLVVVLTLEGSSDFVVYDSDGEHVFNVEPGSLALMRATNLVGDPEDVNTQTQLCPEHGVVNVRSLPRTSLIVRDNLKPLEAVPGFTYDNWTGARPACTLRGQDR